MDDDGVSRGEIEGALASPEIKGLYVLIPFVTHPFLQVSDGCVTLTNSQKILTKKCAKGVTPNESVPPEQPTYLIWQIFSLGGRRINGFAASEAS